MIHNQEGQQEKGGGKKGGTNSDTGATTSG
jgi:hypothetical protein